MSSLTPKQERFCLAYHETGNASEAYRQAYDADGMQPATINRKAKELLDNGKIAARLEGLRDEAAARSAVTVDSLLMELEEARNAALGAFIPQAGAAVSASMSKAKLLGLDVAKVELSGANGGAVKTEEVGRGFGALAQLITIGKKVAAEDKNKGKV